MLPSAPETDLNITYTLRLHKMSLLNRHARLKELGMTFGGSSWELRITALPSFFAASLGPWEVPSKAGSWLPAPVPPPSARPPELRATAPAPALPHMATDVNPNPLLGNISILWSFLQPLALIIGPATNLSSCPAASQQQPLLGQTILKSLFSAEGGLDWVHHPWHKPMAVLEISSSYFPTTSCSDTSFHGAALYSGRGKWGRIKAIFFFLAIARKDWTDSNKGVHNGMVMCGCMWKVEILYTGIAAEVSLEAMTEPESPSKIQINHLAVGMTKPSDSSWCLCILWSIKNWWGLKWNNILQI